MQNAILPRLILSETASCAKARLAFAVKIHPFPPALRSVRNSRPAQSALTEKRGFRWRELNFIWVQRHAASLNVCDAPHCGSMSKHFTFIRKICSLIHLQYLCEERCFAIAFCEYEAYQGAASRCHISRFCLGKNISLFGV